MNENKEAVVSVGDFEGPLDLLLSLVQKNKIDIYDIAIAEIADQYLAIIRAWQTMDMAVASDFVVMASRLLEIKSYKLLPRTAQQDAEDPQEKLIKQLADYQQFKQASFYLERALAQNSGAVYRDPMPMDVPEALAPITVDGATLADRYDKVMRRYRADNAFRDQPQARPQTATYTTQQQREKICALLGQSQHRPIYFSNVIFDYKSSEVVASFLAMLDLQKENRVTLEQRFAFDDIKVSEIHGTASQHTSN